IRRWHWLAGLGMLAVLLVACAAQQVTWYYRLAPDTRSPAIIECLNRHDARGAFADYWLSYKVTFLTDEQLIVAPSNGVDRYPPYTALVQSLGLTPSSQPCHSLLLY